MELEELAGLFKALSDPTRLRLVELLARPEGEGGLCVQALARRLGISQPAVSQHLATLRAVGLVIPQRRGYFVHYRLNRARFDQWREGVQAVLGRDSL